MSVSDLVSGRRPAAAEKENRGQLDPLLRELIQGVPRVPPEATRPEGPADGELEAGADRASLHGEEPAWGAAHESTQARWWGRAWVWGLAGVAAAVATVAVRRRVTFGAPAPSSSSAPAPEPMSDPMGGADDFWLRL